MHPRQKNNAKKRAKKLRKIKEGGNNFTFQTFDGSYGNMDKVLTFIQQFDAAFGGEDFIKSCKICNVAIHLTKSTIHFGGSHYLPKIKLLRYERCVDLLS